MLENFLKAENVFNIIPNTPLEDPTGKIYGLGYLDNVGAMQIGEGTNVFRGDKSGIWLGAKEWADAPFRVNMDGDVVVGSIVLLGDSQRIYFNSGKDAYIEYLGAGSGGLYIYSGCGQMHIGTAGGPPQLNWGETGFENDLRITGGASVRITNANLRVTNDIYADDLFVDDISCTDIGAATIVTTGLGSIGSSLTVNDNITITTGYLQFEDIAQLEVISNELRIYTVNGANIKLDPDGNVTCHNDFLMQGDDGTNDFALQNGGEFWIESPDESETVMFEQSDGDNCDIRFANVTIHADLEVDGTITKGGGGFKINHPLKPDTHYLVHGFCEAPEAVVFYRGEAKLGNDNTVTIKLPDYFEALTQKNNRTVQLTCKNGWGGICINGEVSNGEFTVRGEQIGQEFFWEVKAVRGDAFVKVSPLFDKDGSLIVEPTKEDFDAKNSEKALKIKTERDAEMFEHLRRKGEKGKKRVAGIMAARAIKNGVEKKSKK